MTKARLEEFQAWLYKEDDAKSSRRQMYQELKKGFENETSHQD